MYEHKWVARRGILLKNISTWRISQVISHAFCSFTGGSAQKEMLFVCSKHAMLLGSCS